MIDLLKPSCPCCHSEELQRHTTYQTINHGQLIIYLCTQCGKHFSPTTNTFMAGIRNPFSLISQVLKSRTGNFSITLGIAQNV